MTTEIEQVNSQVDEQIEDAIEQVSNNGEASMETPPVDSPVDSLPASDTVVMSDTSASDSAEEMWQSFQFQATAFLDTAKENFITLFRNNRQLFYALGWIFLAFFGIRILFAVMNAIDDIPFVTFFLKLIGFFYVVRFVQRYLVRANNRREFVQMLDHAKAEFIGDQS
jgi:CAAD domains of cyanobacterial aminoacyl-tRNA synthetase